MTKKSISDSQFSRDLFINYYVTIFILNFQVKNGLLPKDSKIFYDETPFPLGFNDNIYHEGNISKMPDFDTFFLLDITKSNKQSHGKRKNGNFKRKHKTVLSLFDLNILLNSGRHQMLSKLTSLSISSLRKLDDETKFYDRKHDLYDAAFLTRCYTQHALHPFIDSEINHIRHFIKIPLIKVLNS